MEEISMVSEIMLKELGFQIRLVRLIMLLILISLIVVQFRFVKLVSLLEFLVSVVLLNLGDFIKLKSMVTFRGLII